MKEKKGPLKRKIVAFLERLLNPSEGEPENDANNVNEKREPEGSLSFHINHLMIYSSR